MRILCFSINPVFIDLVSGGASLHLLRICAYLTEHGHEVSILCPPANSDSDKIFTLPSGVTVYPELPFHLPFPQPYAISPGDLANIVETIHKHLIHADRFYVHDGELLIPALQKLIPTVVSFRDNYYPESVLGSFITQADEIICVSPYSAKVITASAGRVYRGVKERIHIVPNGIDPTTFFPVPKESNSVLKALNLENKSPIILHPHRPELGKGMIESLEVCKKLIQTYKFSGLTLLTFTWAKEMNGAAEQAFYQEIKEQINQYELNAHIRQLPWQGPEKMREVYSLSNLTLCLGTVPEAFGNVAYESLACGTPSLVTNLGVHRTLLTDDLITKTDPLDNDMAARKASELLRSKKRLSDSNRKAVLAQLNSAAMLAKYEEIIIGAQLRPVPEFDPLIVDESTQFTLAPWCFEKDSKVYDDYTSRYYPIEMLNDRLNAYQAGLLIPIRQN